MFLKSSSSGLRDWLVQRLSAVIIGLYTLFIIVYLLENQPLYFAQWQSLFQTEIMKTATLIVLLAILLHAWIGLWTVCTDYIKKTGIRLFLQTIIFILLLAYVLWGVDILWG